MVYLGKIVFCMIFQCYIYSIFAGSVSYTCNENEYLNVESGLCSLCTVCYDTVGLVTWTPCMIDSDTVCGPKWTVPESVITKQTTTRDRNSELQNTDDNSWTLAAIEHLSLVCLIVSVFAAAILVTGTVWFLHRRRRTRTSYNIVYRDEVKSLHEIAQDRTAAVESANFYVRVEDIMRLNTKSEV